MSTAALKINVLELIVKSSDESALLRIYKKMKTEFKGQEVSEYSLNETEEIELFKSYDESFDEDNLSTHQDAIEVHSKWLKK